MITMTGTTEAKMAEPTYTAERERDVYGIAELLGRNVGACIETGRLNGRIFR